MSIPTVFSTANCQNSPSGPLGGGGMARFCQTYPEHPLLEDYCWINTQENYNTWQLGCVNDKQGIFVDNNNNTVLLEHKLGYYPHIDEAIEFPIDSHDNYYVLPAPHYEAPYPLVLTESNCINTHVQAVFMCPIRPDWSQYETTAPPGTCVVIDDASLQQFGYGCVNSAHGTFINPIDGSITTPEIPNDFTGTAPPYSFVPRPTGVSPTGDFWTESSYLATHTEDSADSNSYSNSYEVVSTASDSQDTYTQSYSDSYGWSDNNGITSTDNLDSSSSAPTELPSSFETTSSSFSSNTCTTRCMT
ncbi:hypothetical protein LPJ73_001685 [Coemansia sp. RSA 2703]|nr:hypothetical protein LPJ73_001685 [Coemansia sp. RSA 2703]